MGNKTFADLGVFNVAFNHAATLTCSRHGIREDNITASKGQPNDVYTVNIFSDKVIMRITCPHITNYQGKLSDINGITVFLPLDGRKETRINFLWCIGEIGIATGAIQKVSEISAFLKFLGVQNSLDKDRARNSIEINGLKYGYITVKNIGCTFYVTK